PKKLFDALRSVPMRYTVSYLSIEAIKINTHFIRSLTDIDPTNIKQFDIKNYKVSKTIDRSDCKKFLEWLESIPERGEEKKMGPPFFVDDHKELQDELLSHLI
ncbi:hypothetical protein PENTCL1PPCAC_18525, partial [Pristionchus entomophagus]